MEDHPTAFEYDWRTRFGLPARSVLDGTLTWRESYALVAELLRDPTSHLAAAVGDLEYPWPREAFILADLYDLLVAANTDRKHRNRIKPYPRPVKNGLHRRRSRRPTVDQATVRAALISMGH